MEATKTTNARKELFVRENRRNTLPGMAVLGFLILSAILFSFGLWIHFYKADNPLTAEYKDDSVYVTASWGKEARIPEDAELRACEVTPETDGAAYEKKLASAMAAVGGDGEAAPANVIYNVGFYVGDEEIEPAAPVDVSLQSLKGGFAAGEAVKVIHLGEDSTQVVSDTLVDEEGFVSFTSDRFSDFVFVSEKEKEEKMEVAETDGIRVTVKYGPEANIPEGAELKAERILPEGDTEEYYTQRLEEADEIYKEQAGEDDTQVFIPLALLNVGFYLSDGSEVSPAAPVTVTVQFLDETGAAAGDPITVIHFADTGAETVEGDDFSEENATAFTVSSFSDLFVGTPMLIDAPGTASGTGNAKNFEHNKYIDYLGDNKAETDNGDTDADKEGKIKDDLYRLYLDMTGECEPIDLVIVIDRSSSMKEKMKDGNTRWKTVYNILEGTKSDGSDGLLYEFLKVNEGKKSNEEKNFVSMVWFAGQFYDRNSGSYGSATNAIPPNNSKEGGVVFEWTSSYTRQATTKYDISPDIGVSWGTACTNYVAGFYQADQKLHSLPSGTENHKKVVVFMSDGIPVYYYKASDMSWTNPGSMHRYGGGAERWTYEDWTGSNLIYNYEKNRTHVAPSFYKAPYFNETKKIFNGASNSFVTRNPNISFYTVAIDLEKEKINGWDRTKLLQDMAASYTGGSMYSATNTNGLKQFLKQIMFPAGVTISDELSAYVDLYEEDPDILVTATPKAKAGGSAGDPVILWRGPASGFDVDAENVVKDGTINQLNKVNVIKDVTYDKSTKTISVHFWDDYCLSNEYTYTLSFNVKLTAKAYDDYAKNANEKNSVGEGEALGYKENRGDPNTDYKGNSTSSGKLGFYSNNKATVDYNVNGKTDTLTYDYPVVQAWGSTFGFTKLKRPDVSFSGSGKEPQTDAPFVDVPFRLARTDSADSADNTSSVTPQNERYASRKSEENGETYYLTDEDGTIQYGYLLGGTYTLYELVPSGYVGEDVERVVLEFTVKKGRITLFHPSSVLDGIEVYPADSSVDLTETNSEPNMHYEINGGQVTVTNTPATKKIVVYKKDENDKALKGATFKLYSATEEPAGEGAEKKYIKGKELGTYTSDETGLLFDKEKLELGYGLYILEETSAPDTYEILKDPIVFQVGKDGVEVLANKDHCTDPSFDGDTVILNIINHKIEVDIKLKKIESGSGTAEGGPVYLEGAKFELYADGYPGEKALLWTGTSKNDGNFENTMRGDDGNLVPFPKLTSGTDYYLVEIKAPDGYNILGYVIKLTVESNGTVFATLLDDKGGAVTSGGGIVNVTQTSDAAGNLLYSAEITVSNNSGYELPETGGPGTILYLLTGLVLVLGSAAVLSARRRLRRVQ